MAGERILVVDDVGYNRAIMTRLLVPEGYAVDAAGGATEAIRLLSRNRYNLAIVDLMMPEMNGLEVCEKAISETYCDDAGEIPNPPFILCTAFVNEHVISQALAAGFKSVLAKPLDRTRVLETVREAMTSAQIEIGLRLEGEEAAALAAFSQKIRAQPEEVVRSILGMVDWQKTGEKVSNLSEFERFVKDRWKRDPGS